MVYVRDGIQGKKPRTAFSGKLVSIEADNAPIVQELNGQKMENCFRYLDLAVVDEDETGNRTWHNIRLSALKENPIALDKIDVLKKCDELLKQKIKPQVRGHYYLSIKVAQDEKGRPLLRDGQPVIYENKRMSVGDLAMFEVVDEGQAG